MTRTKPAILTALLLALAGPSAHAEPGSGAAPVANNEAVSCKVKFDKANGDCSKAQHECAEKNDSSVNGMRATAACYREVAAALDEAAKKCRAEAQKALRDCGQSQANVNVLDQQERQSRAARHESTATTQTLSGKQALPDFKTAHDIIHQSWWGANDLQNSKAPEIEKAAAQLREQAANLENQANQQSTVKQNPGGGSAKDPAASSPGGQKNAAADNKNQNAGQGAGAGGAGAASAAAPGSADPAIAATPAAVNDAAAAGGSADGLSAALSPSEFNDPSITPDPDGDHSRNAESEFSAAALARALGRGSAAALPAGGVGGGGLAPVPAAAPTAAPEAQKKAAFPATVSSGSSGGGGGRGPASFGVLPRAESSAKSFYDLSNADRGGNDKAAPVDLAGFLPGSGKRGPASLESLGINGPHVNMFNKITSRYKYYLETDSLNP